MVQAYAGKVRTDIDHNAYKPAAWRVDSYLDESDEEEDLVGSLRSHRLVFSKDSGAVDAMARQEKVDDYKVEAQLYHMHSVAVAQQTGFGGVGMFVSIILVIICVAKTV